MQSHISVPISAIIIVVLSFCVLAPQSITCAEPLARITVEAGWHTRIDTPVSLSLDAVPLGLPDSKMHLQEITDSGRIVVPTQLEPGSPPRLWWILSGTTQAGARRVYELVGASAALVPGVDVARDDEVLQIRKGGLEVLSYNHAIVPPPEGQSELYNRSGFVHPLWSPTGAVLTNIHPLDHYHHLGIWMPWTHTEFEGKEVDFWNLAKGQGTVRFKRFVSTTNGPVYGGFRAEHEHVALNTDEGEKVVLGEVWDVRVYNVGGPDEGYWLWDFVSVQRCVADSPLYQTEYRYGGFGFRGAAEWSGANAAYLTSEGKTRKDGHATRARWCDTSGAIGGKWAGVTHMSHPENFRHPEPMRIWPRFEQQVFFNWAPSQAGDWVMESGEDHFFRYRLYVHEGRVDVADSERIWRDYAEPPEVTLQWTAKNSAIVLFDGTDFSHWTYGDDKPIGWEIVDGAMKIVPKTGSIMTKRDFRDFKLHVEFKTPQMPPNVMGQDSGNSGIYIQRRYEVQILDSYGREPEYNGGGSIYKFKAPDTNACRMPDRWQSYDISFCAARFEGSGRDAKKKENARITVWHNGILIHDDVELQNKTGAGRPEGPEPGPILLQNHGNEVCFRNIWIVPQENQNCGVPKGQRGPHFAFFRKMGALP
jgi:hypothetical protein